VWGGGGVFSLGGSGSFYGGCGLCDNLGVHIMIDVMG